MSPVSPSRRRAERFDRVVDGAPAGALDPRTTELLDLVVALRATSSPQARPVFVADLRSQLMLAAETELRPVTAGVTAAARPVRTRRERRIAVALGGFALVGASASMAVAAQSALPGETLYPLKRAIEDADTRLSADADKGTGLLDHASSRLTELDEMTRAPIDERRTPVIESTLDSFADQAGQASEVLITTYAETGDEATIDQLHVFADQSLSTLGRLEGELPSDVRPSVLRAAQTLFRIDEAATRACPACADVGISQVPGALVGATLPGDATGGPLATVETPRPPGSTGTSKKNAGTPGRAPATQAAGPTAPGAGTPAAPGPDATEIPVRAPVKASVKAPSGKDVVGGLVGTVTGKGNGKGTNGPTPAPPVAPPPVLGEVLGGTIEGLDETTDELLP